MSHVTNLALSFVVCFGALHGLLLFFNKYCKVAKKDQYKYPREMRKNVEEAITNFPLQGMPSLGYVGSDYVVLYNHIKADNQQQYGPLETVTYVTHGQYDYFDNLGPLMERWRAPLSIAVFAPGSDYELAFKHAQYYRKCSHHKQLIADNVSFHFFFPSDHVSPSIHKVDRDSIQLDCDNLIEELKRHSENSSYSSLHQMDYPINAARVIARRCAETQFVLLSDIELYPSPGLAKGFIQMVKNNMGIGSIINDVAYVVPVFEMIESQSVTVPADKEELKAMIANKTAFTFHHNYCLDCHMVPHFKEWLSDKETRDVRIHSTMKWRSRLDVIPILSKNAPFHDLRLTWNGLKDNRILAYTLCRVGYEFALLDNAFMMHRPEIKTSKEHSAKLKMDQQKIMAQDNLIRKKVLKDLEDVYGPDNNNCKL